jgi:hypothetical protein
VLARQLAEEMKIAKTKDVNDLRLKKSFVL